MVVCFRVILVDLWLQMTHLLVLSLIQRNAPGVDTLAFTSRSLIYMTGYAIYFGKQTRTHRVASKLG
jgi:hypothetical protein